MPGKYIERSLIDFQKSFPDSEWYARHLAEQCWLDGFICAQCGHRDAYYLSKRRLFD